MYHILTHPLINNYGGILQAYAMQQTLNKLDRKSDIIHYIPRCIIDFRKRQGKRAVVNYVLSILKLIFNKAETLFPYYFFPWLFSRFRFASLKTIRLADDRSNLQKIAATGAFVVGSDQVWRDTQTQHLENLPFFFLDFTSKSTRQKSIAYAASFGTDEWEASPEITEICAALAKDFKAISVREHSGVRICKEVLGINAVQMPDPTLLLTREEYIKLMNSRWTKTYACPSIAVYLLDETAEQQQVLADISTKLAMPMQALTAHAKADKLADRLPLSIQQWLRYIRDAEFLITDSFHGCVFAIIFNTPFVCLGNHGRGEARFSSLFQTFNLKKRLVSTCSPENILQVLYDPIDWQQINQTINQEQKRAFTFLSSNI